MMVLSCVLAVGIMKGTTKAAKVQIALFAKKSLKILPTSSISMSSICTGQLPATRKEMD